MKKVLFIVLPVLTLFSCLKKMENDVVGTNIFDPTIDRGAWFKQKSIDSSLIGGSVYKYFLTYEVVDKELLTTTQKFKIGVKRNDSSIYGSTSKKGNLFSFAMLNKHRVDGVFCFSLGLAPLDNKVVAAFQEDCFEE